MLGLAGRYHRYASAAITPPHAASALNSDCRRAAAGRQQQSTRERCRRQASEVNIRFTTRDVVARRKSEEPRA